MEPTSGCTWDQTFVAPESADCGPGTHVAPLCVPLLLVSCASGAHLARRVAQRYGELLAAAGSSASLAHLEAVDFQFANGESCARLDAPVNGRDVFLVQALRDPVSGRGVDQNYMALLMAARALREHGAYSVTAVLPYLAYGRQDKPTEFLREPTTARLMADLTRAAGVDRLVAWHPHCGQLRGFYGDIPVHMLGPLTLFIERFRQYRGRRDTIVVAPDAGASGLATSCGRALQLDCAIGAKHRPRPDVAQITQIIGDFSGKTTAIVLDDEFSTGGTVHGLIRKLVDEHGIQRVLFGVSHNCCAAQGRERLEELHEQYGLREVIVTNSIPQTPEFEALPFLSVECLSEPLARAINRIHFGRSVSEVFYRPD